MLAGTMLMGFGAFNVEGLVDHQLLGLHHVNESAPREQWIYWDGGFIIWGAAMLATGSLLFKQGKHQTPRGGPQHAARLKLGAVSYSKSAFSRSIFEANATDSTSPSAARSFGKSTSSSCWMCFSTSDRSSDA
jgi:Predicted membrane protein (DUF2243)